MADLRLPLLRGRITSIDTYQAPQPGRGKLPRLPSLDPHGHGARLLQQLDAIRTTVNSRSGTARDELATREIIAVLPVPGADHWIQGARLLVAPRDGTASEANHEKWPILTHGAVRAAEDADSRPRNRVFTMAVTRTMQELPFNEPVPTLESRSGLPLPNSTRSFSSPRRFTSQPKLLTRLPSVRSLSVLSFQPDGRTRSTASSRRSREESRHSRVQALPAANGPSSPTW